MPAVFEVRSSEARGILSRTSGFIAESGFTHSLTPARNCTYGCTYCYVPTMGLYGGLQQEDWRRWGQFTTFKENAAGLLARQLKATQRIYCSPLVDPYQPAEEQAPHMPAILEALLEKPPAVFVIQTRGPGILRDKHPLQALARRTILRVSFSITTNRDEVRRLFEPHCPSFEERLDTVRALCAAGIETYATLAPLLPCDPEILALAAIEATGRDLIGDPLHVRAVKRHGATTREAAFRICEKNGYDDWLEPGFQAETVARIRVAARALGKDFVTGPEGFSQLARVDSTNEELLRSSS
ncbi:MAG: radical SAM protein [Acidobacteriota bacterium]